MNESNNSTPIAASPSPTTQAISSNEGGIAAELNPLVATSTAPAPIAKSWHDELPEDLRSDETLKRFKSPADLGKSYVEARKKFGNPEKLMTIPDEADAKAWNEVYDKLGRPKDPKEYEFASVDGIDFDKEGIPQYQEMFHKLGLTKSQVTGLTKEYAAMRAQEIQKYTAQEQEQQQAELVKMKAEIGDKLEIFNNVVERTFNSINERMGGELYKKLEAKGLTHDPVILKFMYEIGKQNMDDSLRAGRGASSIGFGAGEAASKIEALKSDKAFQARLLNGDAEANKEWQSLFKIAYPPKNAYNSI